MMAKLYQKSEIRMADLMAAALDIQGRCKDIILPAGYTGRGNKKVPTGAVNPGLTSATVALEGDFGTITFLAPIGVGDREKTTLSVPVSARLTDWSLYQLCSIRLGIPHAFMRKCLGDQHPDIRELFPETVNRFMSHYDIGTRIRLYQPEDGGPLEVRGIVTESYAVFDSDRVVETVMDVVGDSFNVVGHNIDESGVHLRLTTPDPLEVNGEDLYPGLLITSGDVGNRSLEVRFFLWKQVCTNGLVMSRLTGKVLHKRHLGIYNSDDFQSALVEALGNFSTFCENAKEIVEKARSKELDADAMNELLNSFKANVKLDEAEEKELLEMTAGKYSGEGGVITLWGFINAITEFAQADRFDLDSRTEVETYAADLLMAA